MINLFLYTGLSLLFLVIAFRPMEAYFPIHAKQKLFRPHWFTDLCFFLGQYLLWGALITFVLIHFNVWLDSNLNQSFRVQVAVQPLWLQVIEVVVLSDFLIYWAHRLQHKIPFLWRFHKVHHTAEHMDWLAAHREHPLDSIYTVAIINLPALIMGFPLEMIAGFIAFRGIWAIYIHSNVKIPLGPLKYIIGSPELHHWHHDKNKDAGNYANISPLMDIIFGTHVCPGHFPESYGIEEEFPKSYGGQLIKPLLPKKISWPSKIKYFKGLNGRKQRLQNRQTTSILHPKTKGVEAVKTGE